MKSTQYQSDIIIFQVRNFGVDFQGFLLRTLGELNTICPACYQQKYRKFKSDEKYTPKKSKKKLKYQEKFKCIIPSCIAESRCSTNINIDHIKIVCGAELDEKYNNTQQNLCQHHYFQYKGNKEECIVCGKILRGQSRKRCPKLIEKNKIKEAFEEKSLSLPNDFFSSRYEVCNSCIYNPQKNIKNPIQIEDITATSSIEKKSINLDDTATEHIEDEETRFESISTHCIEEEITIFEDDDINKVNKIREAGLKQTLTYLKNLLESNEFVILKDIFGCIS